MNPWEKLDPPITNINIYIDEIIQKAFRDSAKIGYKGKIKTARMRERLRISVIYRGIKKNLTRTYAILNSYYESNEFYKELINIYFKEEEINSSLKKIKGLIGILNNLYNNYIKKLYSCRDPNDMIPIRKEAIGRLVSILKRNRKIIHLAYRIWKYAHKLPSFDFSQPIVVVAGPPNVGKSTLVKTFSTAKVEVASYPFTTKDIHVGHIFTKFFSIQIVDTPGLLDRPLKERNDTELKAIYALKHLPDIVIFIFDPSPHRFYDPDKQIAIYNDVKKLFKDKEKILVVNKIDIAEIDFKKYLVNDNIFELSLKENIGVIDLKKELINRVIKIHKIAV